MYFGGIAFVQGDNEENSPLRSMIMRMLPELTTEVKT